MRSGMAGKHDEMLIYILHSADLAATAGTNSAVSGEAVLETGSTAGMDRPLLEEFTTAQGLCSRKFSAALSQGSYPGMVQ